MSVSRNTSGSSASPAEAQAESLDERIRRRAYEIWQREGQPEGQDVDFWREAEDEIVAEDEGDAAS